MAITAEEKYLLNNRMGKVANKVQLGTLIENAEAVLASEITLADGNVLVGNGSNVGAAVTLSGDATIDNTGVVSLSGFDHSTEGLEKIEKVAVVDYDFSAEGGSQGTIGLGTSLPDNAVVTKVIEDITTDYNSSGNTGTLKLVLPTDGDLSSNVTADGSNAGVSSVLPSGTPVKTTAARELSVTIATEDLTAGVSRFFVFYVESN